MAAGDVTVGVTTNIGKQCALFDGTDDVVTITDSSRILNCDQPFTVSFWIKTDAPLSVGMGIIGKHETTGDKRTAGFRFAATGKIQFSVWEDGRAATGKSAGIPNVIVNDNQWHLVVGNFNGNVIRCTVDGTSGSAAATNGGFVEGTINWLIGKNTSGADDFFQGQLADVRFYRVSLTSTEGTALLNNQPVTRGLIHRYSFHDGTYNDRVGSKDGSNSGAYLTIGEENISAVVDADRVTANDQWLIFSGADGQVGTVNIEEAP